MHDFKSIVFPFLLTVASTLKNGSHFKVYVPREILARDSVPWGLVISLLVHKQDKLSKVFPFCHCAWKIWQNVNKEAFSSELFSEATKGMLLGTTIFNVIYYIYIYWVLCFGDLSNCTVFFNNNLSIPKPPEKRRIKKADYTLTRLTALYSSEPSDSEEYRNNTFVHSHFVYQSVEENYIKFL